MARDPLACGDLIAQRRFEYARAAADDGDFNAAADVLEQALERAPDWAAAWFALGEARVRLGDLDGAAEAFRATLRVDSSDTHGAKARLAIIGRGDAPDVLPRAYVARLFDEYAPRFDNHLTKNLGYRAPDLIASALTAAAPRRRFASVLDIGCGTGLMGRALRDRVDHLTGVDLSQAMIAKAREHGVYDELEAADAVAFLERLTRSTFDCVLAADALMYFADLAPLFGAVAAALSADGIFAFSIETFAGDGFRLAPTMRFAHARSYVEAAADAAGLRPLVIRAASTRREAGADAPSLICVFESVRRSDQDWATPR